MGKYLLLYALLQEITVKLALAVLQIASLRFIYKQCRKESLPAEIIQAFDVVGWTFQSSPNLAILNYSGTTGIAFSLLSSYNRYIS